MSEQSRITWNSELVLAISDVDETIADVNVAAEPEMVQELSSYLIDGGRLFMVTGASLDRVTTGVTDLISPTLRKSIIVAACSGAEVWGFDAAGNVLVDPFYSIYDKTFTPEMKQSWRKLVEQIVSEFSLRTHPMQPKDSFREQVGSDPLDIMADDRGPQITFTLPNARDISTDYLNKAPYDVPLTDGRYDLRVLIVNRATELFAANNIPIQARLGGNYSIDFAISGISKRTAVEYVLSNQYVMETLQLDGNLLAEPQRLEVWGDKYSVTDGGTDRFISEALPTQVRSIDFRPEDPAQFPDGYNITVWDGTEHLHHGLLEYLRSRHK